MIFNSLSFLIFFPLTVLFYFLIPTRFRYIWLLICSYVFYLSQNTGFVVLLIFSTLLTYFCGLLLDKTEDIHIRRLIILFTVIINLGILIYFKYSGFILSLFGKSDSLSLIVPAGISFYTFQSLSYVLDCYRKKCKAQYNILKYALFVSFFPCILSGPIERGSHLLSQFDDEHTFDTERIKRGLFMMLWGYFLKMVIVSRLSILTDLVYDNPELQTGFAVLVAVIFYFFRIYCDFAGYSYIAIGSAKIMGFDILTNFRRPYLAVSVADFWRRWHISLSTWFRDYLYIPLGGNRVSAIRRYLNIMIVFLVSGLWHGANMTFVFWGFLYGVYQIVGYCLLPLRTKITGFFEAKNMAPCLKVLEIAVTDVIVCLTWVIFASKNIRSSFYILCKLFSDLHFADFINGSIFNLGLGAANLLFVIAALTILIIVDIICERRSCDVDMLLERVPLLVRWTFYYVLIIMILMSCNLSTQEFLYQQF